MCERLKSVRKLEKKEENKRKKRPNLGKVREEELTKKRMDKELMFLKEIKEVSSKASETKRS